MKNEKRLIDANALDRKIVEMTREPAYQHTGEDWLNGLCMAMEAINETPTVDAVEVVRCKDCRHYEPPEDGDSLGVCRNQHLCVSNLGEVYPQENYYCPYGKRK